MNDINTKILRLSDLRDHRLSELTGMIRAFIGIKEQGMEQMANNIIQWIEAKEEIHEHWIIDNLRRTYWDFINTRGDKVNKTEIINYCIQQVLPDLEERFKEITNIPVADYDRSDEIITFNDKIFVFTGDFTSCSRDIAIHLTKSVGGVIADSVSLKTDYLIVGCKCSEEWKTTAYGRKIELAGRYRKENKSKIRIIAEPKWALDLTKMMKIIDDTKPIDDMEQIHTLQSI